MEADTTQYSVSATKDFLPCMQCKQCSVQHAHLMNCIDWCKQAALFAYKSCTSGFSGLSQSLCEHISWSPEETTVKNSGLISKSKQYFLAFENQTKYSTVRTNLQTINLTWWKLKILFLHKPTDLEVFIWQEALG